MNRRRFLCVSGGAVLAVTPASTKLSAMDSGLPVFHRRSHAFGTSVSITVRHQSNKVAEAALDSAVSQLTLVNGLMSVYDSDSQLTQLNREGLLTNPHPCVVDVLQAAEKYSRLTSGAFDVTVQPLWSLYAKAAADGALPTPDLVASVAKRVDWRRVQVDDQRIRLHGQGTAVTLNGIAQGYATDLALSTLRQHGITDALVDAGEVGALGSKQPGRDWHVGIQHPRREDAFISRARFSNRCLATSGDYQAKFSDDYRAHHIFDPRTGVSPTRYASISVLAPTAVEADALSTAVFVLGLDRIRQLAGSRPDVDFLLVHKDGSLRATKGFPRAE